MVVPSRIIQNWIFEERDVVIWPCLSRDGLGAHARPEQALMANYYSSRSPPPLQHPVPTHPAYIPEPPSTPASPQGYQRYASSPPPAQSSQHFSHPSAYPQYPHQPSHLTPLHNQSAPPHGIPDFSAWGIDGATAQFGMQLGQNAVAAGQNYFQRNVPFCSISSSALF